MPKDKSDSHKRVLEAAKNEFLEFGFVDASMRRIAQNAGLTVSGLYKHFSSKEDMFAALVDPAIDAFYALYHSRETEEFGIMESTDKEDYLDDQEATRRIMHFIYDHIDAFKLIVSGSQGTRYESFAHDVAEMEEATTLRYMEGLKAKGIKIKDIDIKHFHLLMTGNVEAVLEAVRHDFTREEALDYAKTLDEFYTPSWKRFFGA
ncbi:MAG: TetR/AcrR family transcriptional regulator [Clostridiales bacterium]|nr:TetR/AcrR family transcriptional regulator [Clostridiales bacterium]HAW15707.1 TetR family transcriptional regulator [Clostridiales bacterium]